ncbi:hypothetical protein L198_08178 [Cryptococcus wingfieldii CBS 7118]|uniref:Semialdehyde dehydrogenase NAD-binding domain-containing protein n=1 Tax=Cryptococcus wingfieldii CBS 7118 TaxID=1295528 RepID=A0A1E3HF76_9TREE|nr:hypothetical protein L198_08178 [Cryptococcus wingfieldii CBS 7118]ODN74992.1 hypothetical protein L198_08178 [Cryptococcus wingfieldii CBS 7118]
MWLPSKDNALADALSRYQWTEVCRLDRPAFWAALRWRAQRSSLCIYIPFIRCTPSHLDHRLAMSTPTPVTILGSTGLTGSETLQVLLTSSNPFSITTATRRPIPSPFPKCKPTNAQTVLDERI